MANRKPFHVLCIMSSLQEMEPKKSSASFTLECEDEAFSARRESIFGSLPVVELAHKELPSIPTNSTFDITIEEESSRNEDVTIYKGEESMFKRPMPKLKKPSHPPRRNLNTNKMHTPDHKKNPHKWVKYNLSSTTEVTDKSNTAAALSFLRELEDRKRKLEPEDVEPTDSSGKIVFKKPKTTDQRSTKNKTYRDGKLCMPAFEFGSKKPKDNKSKKQTAKTGMDSSSHKKQRCLSHLDEEEDEEVEGNDDGKNKM